MLFSSFNMFYYKYCFGKIVIKFRAHAVFVKNKSCDFNTTHAETDLLKKAAEKFVLFLHDIFYY